MRIMELGAGKTGLIGFALAAIAQSMGQAIQSVITDGNHKCVESLRKNLELNPQLQEVTQV